MFQGQEMKGFLKNLRTKAGKPEHSFGLSFNNDSEDIYITRGESQDRSLNEFLIKKSIKSLQDFLR